MNGTIGRNDHHSGNWPRMLVLALSIAAASSLDGCAHIFKTNVPDLKLLSVSLQKADDVPHGPGWTLQPNRQVLVATLQTAYDFESMEKAYGYIGITANITSCRTAAKLWPASVYDVTASAPPRSHDHTYEIWFDYKWPAARFGTDYAGYNLRENPEDLCVEFSAYPYMGIGIGLESNTVVLPRQAIIDALR